MCRLGARKVSAIKPQLDANGVGLVGIGLERLGVDEFLEKNFFAGTVYIDEMKQNYKDLGFKRYGLLSVVASLLTRITRAAISEARSQGISGNFSGDGFQNGGLLVVSKGGDPVLLDFKQESPGHHVENQVILDALNITVSKETLEQIQSEVDDTLVECNDGGCDDGPKPLKFNA